MEIEKNNNKDNMKDNKTNKKSSVLKRILAWSSVVLIILFTIFMMVVGGFISDYELSEGGIVGVPLAMPIAVFIGTIISLGAVLLISSKTCAAISSVLSKSESFPEAQTHLNGPNP